MAKLNVTLKYDDLGVNTALDNQAAMLNIATLVLSSTQADTSISTDPNNDLKLGSDGKLKVVTDELNTSFDYASSVSTFWSI